VRFLLDTSLVSELVKPRPNAAVLNWLEQCDEDALFLSVLTIGEPEKGIAKVTDPRRRARLTSLVRKDLGARFGRRLLAIDVEVAARWGAMTDSPSVEVSHCLWWTV